MRIRFAWAAIIALATLSAASFAADDRTFDVHFERPYKAGQAFTLTSTDTVRSSQKTDTPDGQTTRASNFRRTQVDADVKVEKVADKGQPAAMSLTIRKLTQQNSSDADSATKPVDLLAASTFLAVTFTDHEPSFTDRAGKGIPDDAAAILKRALGPPAFTDDAYGSKGQKKIGDAWPVNTKALPVDRLNPQSIDPADLAGNMTLKGVRSVAGVECLQLEATLSTDKVSVGEVKPVEAKVTVTQTEALPVDASKPPVATSTKSALHVVVERKPLGKGVVRTTFDSETSHEAMWTAK